MSDDIGYGKPPKSKQFKQGQSGNPKGRPKGVRNLDEGMRKELRRKITINVGGKESNVLWPIAFMKKLQAQALGGDMRAAKMVFDYIDRMSAEGVGTEPEVVTQDDVAILDRFKAELRIIVEHELQEAAQAGAAKP